MCVPVLSRVTSNCFEDLPKKDALDGGWALPIPGERAWHRGSPHSPGKGWKHTISPVFHHFFTFGSLQADLPIKCHTSFLKLLPKSPPFIGGQPTQGASQDNILSRMELEKTSFLTLSPHLTDGETEAQ